MAKININASPDEIQQVVSSIVPPQIPSQPLPPPPPMPVPAQAGYKAFASDPLNQSAISKHITPPNTSILPPPPPAAAPTPQPWAPSAPSSTVLPPGMTPPAQMASVNPPQPQMASANPPQVAPVAQPSLYGSPSASPPQTQAQYFAANPKQQATSPWAGKWIGSKGLNLLASGLAGAAGGMNKDPGAGLRYVQQLNQEAQQVPEVNNSRYRAAVVQPQIDALNASNTQSQINERNAAAKKSDALGDADTPFSITPLQAQAIGHPELAGTQATMRDYNRVLMGADKNTTTTKTNAATNAKDITTTGMNNTTSTANNTANNTTKETVADAANKTKTLVASMHDATSRANNANTNDHKGSAGSGSFKVPADVTKRAALGSNVLENADAVDEILKNRPDIVGASGGRYTNVQQMIGSNDPDIQALGVRMHNIALASNGAHGVRAQQAIQKTEDELFSNFKAGPKAIAGALNATRSSMQTFLDDEKNFATTGQRTGGNNMVPPPQGGGTMFARDTQGKLHQAPVGAVLPPGWKAGK